MANTKLHNIIDKFSSLTEKPVKYLAVQEDIKDDIKNLVKTLYDYTKFQEDTGKSSKNQALSEIIVKDFDEEQIWQQIELQNSQCWDHFVWDVANCISSKNDLTFPIKFTEEIDHAEESNMDQNMSATENESPIQDIEKKKISKTKSKESPIQDIEKKKISKTKSKEKKSSLKTKKSIVDDQFFKLQDMEKFLINEEKIEEKGKKEKKGDDDDEDSIDLFEDIDSEGSEDGRKEIKYSDFFFDENDDENEYNTNYVEDNNDDDDDDYYDYDDTDSKKGGRFVELDTGEEEISKNVKKVRFVQPDSDDSDSNGSMDETPNKQLNGDSSKEEKKSEFELRQQRLKQQISKLEEKTLREAPWQLKGEIDASKRPQNSLLEEILDFDLTMRPPPIITEQTTLTLEGLIRQRIKDKAWDDVVKKEKPVDDQLTFKKPEVLDQSKSKLSLAQVYESEYLKQKQAISGEVQEEKEPESHTEIRNAMSKLFSKLDALCHYHYTPKPPQAEVKIVSNTPAISIEEVAPVATSDATLLAPEEVKKKRKGDLMSKEERTQTDKNRERRKKKQFQRKKGQVIKVTDHRNTKKGQESGDKSLKTSKAFFQQLNDDTTSLIKSKKNNVRNK